MTARSRAYFLTGQQTTSNNKFRTNNKPTELVFGDLFDSVPFKLETADTASETVHGLVKLATAAEILARTDTALGFQKVPRVSHLPAVGLTAPQGYVVQGSVAQYNGLQATTGQETDGRMKYLINLLYDTNYFGIMGGATPNLTMSTAFIAAWNELIGLVDPVDGIVLDLDNFPRAVFTDGGVVDDNGVLTVDADTTSIHVDPVTKKVSVVDGGITLAKLQNLQAGEIIVAPTGGGTPVVISLLGVGKILVGTATGVEVKDLNDYLLAINISDNSIKARKLDPGTLGDGITKDMAADDASKLKVSLSANASMEFDTAKLQLVNDDATPSPLCFYGTNSSGAKGYQNLLTSGITFMKTLPKVLIAGPCSQSYDVIDDLLIDPNFVLDLMNFQLKVYVNSGMGTYDEVMDHTVDIIDDGAGHVDTINISLTGTGVPITSDYTYYFVFTYTPTIVVVP